MPPIPVTPPPDWWDQLVVLGIVFTVGFVVSACEQLARNHEQPKVPVVFKANISGWMSVVFSSLIFDRIGESLVRLVIVPCLIGLAGSKGSKIFLEIARMLAKVQLGIPINASVPESHPRKPKPKPHPEEEH